MLENSSLPLQVSMIMLGVEDVARSVRFYRDLLGLEVRHESAEFAFLWAGPITLALGTPLGRAVQPRAGASEVIFGVGSVTAAQAMLAGRGVQFSIDAREVTAGSWAATMTDPDGHRLTLFGPE